MERSPCQQSYKLTIHIYFIVMSIMKFYFICKFATIIVNPEYSFKL
jgi:hypothetical protein